MIYDTLKDFSGKFKEKTLCQQLTVGLFSGVKFSDVSNSEKKKVLCHWGPSTYLLMQLF